MLKEYLKKSDISGAPSSKTESVARLLTRGGDEPGLVRTARGLMSLNDKPDEKMKTGEGATPMPMAPVPQQSGVGSGSTAPTPAPAPVAPQDPTATTPAPTSQTGLIPPNITSPQPWATRTADIRPPGETDTSKVIGDLTSQDSPWMTRARTSGLQMANRRGLLNSSMAVGASQGAAIDAAIPVASQMTSQNFQAQQQDTGYQQNRALQDDRIIAEQQAQVANMTTGMQQLYAGTIESINSNTKMSRDARAAAIEAAKGTLEKQIQMIENLYSINIDW